MFQPEAFTSLLFQRTMHFLIEALETRGRIIHKVQYV